MQYQKGGSKGYRAEKSYLQATKKSKQRRVSGYRARKPKENPENAEDKTRTKR
jgi:hypothetical protein